MHNLNFLCAILVRSPKTIIGTSINIVDGWSKQTTQLVVSFVAFEITTAFFWGKLGPTINNNCMLEKMLLFLY